MSVSDKTAPDNALTHHTEVARRIAAEVHGNHLRGPKMVKVSSLVHAFRVPGAPTRLHDVQNVLESHDLVVESSSSHLERSGCVRLHAADADASPTELPSIRATVWDSTQAGADASLPLADNDAGSVVWFDIDPVRVEAPPAEPEPRDLVERIGLPIRRHAGPSIAPVDVAIDKRAHEIVAQIGDRCDGLEVDMVKDLLREDMQPKVETYGDEDGVVRGVSTVAVVAREVHKEGPDGESAVSTELVFQLLEIIVGENWIVTCWHPTKVVGSSVEDESERSLLKVPFVSHVRHRWATEPGEAKTSSDLGLYLVETFINTYDASHRMMERWLAAWEVDFSTSLKQPDRAARLKLAATDLSDFLHMTAEVRRRLTAFHHARLSTADETWFPLRADTDDGRPEGAEKAAEDYASAKVQAARDHFDGLSSDIQANMDLLMLQSTATQQEASEKVQNSMGLITGLVLVPTFIAGLFGANTRLPGGGSWTGFDFMMGLMLGSAVVVFFFMRRMSK